MEAAIIIGMPVALIINDILDIPGQAGPYASKIIGCMLDRAVVVYQAPYPTAYRGVHDEPMVVGKDGKLTGAWYDLEKFLMDYDPNKNPYARDPYWKNNDPEIELEMIDSLPYDIEVGYEKDQLKKVLNN